MRRRRTLRIAVAVVVGITAESILVEFQPLMLRIPEGALLGGIVDGVLAVWALDTLMRRLRKPEPGIILLTVSGAIILGIAHLLWSLPELLSDPILVLNAIGRHARDGAITGAAIGLAIGLTNRLLQEDRA